MLAAGEPVKKLSRAPDPAHPLSRRVAVGRLQIEDRVALVRELDGAEALYNTFWIRRPQGDMTFERAVECTRTLLRAAREAGVRRIAHVSVTNPSERSPLPYFRLGVRVPTASSVGSVAAAMADEVTLGFTVPGREVDVHAAWREQPPAFLADGGYELKDESYDTLVYEADVTAKSMRVLMFGMATSLYRLSVTLKPDGVAGTRVTITGQAKEDVRQAILRYADERGIDQAD
jgi:hypothetical protein